MRHDVILWYRYWRQQNPNFHCECGFWSLLSLDLSVESKALDQTVVNLMFIHSHFKLKTDLHFKFHTLVSVALHCLYDDRQMHLTSMILCPFHRKQSLAWRFDSVDLECLFSQIWAPAVSFRQNTSRGQKRKRMDVCAARLWTSRFIDLFLPVEWVLPALSAWCLTLLSSPADNGIQHNHGWMLLQGHQAPGILCC